MNVTEHHLPPWTLDGLAEGTLSHAEKSLAEEHLRSCQACTSELEATRAVFAALEALPRYSPSPHFGEAVMARVELRPAVALAPARRWLPRTRKGWAFLAGTLLLPLFPLVPLFAWLFSHPGVTPGSLWGMAKDWAVEGAWSFMVGAAEAVMRSPVAEWVVRQGEALPGGYTTLAALGALFLVAIPISGWAMVRLLRAPTTGGWSHAE